MANHDPSTKTTKNDLDCAHAIELMPWYLNGTLESGEKRALDAHLATCESCRRELAETRQAAAVFASHVPSLDLVQHALGEATDRLDRATIERHLAICPSCRAEAAMAGGGRVIEFPAAPARRRSGRSWRRLAVAASVGAALLTGGLLWDLGSRPAAPPVGDIAAETPGAAGLSSGSPSPTELDPNLLFSDGFESGGTAAWSSDSM